jgi:HK97 family phage prohead protease
MILTRAEAATQRAQGVRQATDRPSQRRQSAEPTSLAVVRAALECREARAETMANGAEGVRLGLYASVTDTPYEMYDFFGPYTEIVAAGAFDDTLRADPMVEFTVNHGAGGGLPMAHTRNGTLDLGADATGLLYEPLVDPTRNDVADMLKAYDRGDLAESSFKFRITAGKWSPDYTEYTITAVDLNRGDVSIVNFGANPFTADATPREEAPAPVDVRAALLELHLAG